MQGMAAEVYLKVSCVSFLSVARGDREHPRSDRIHRQRKDYSAGTSWGIDNGREKGVDVPVQVREGR